MKRRRYRSSIYHGLTVDIKEKLRVAVLDAIFKVLREQRKKTHPSMELLREFVSEDVRRVVARLSDGLEKRHIDREYFVLYKGPGGKRAFKLLKIGAEDMVVLKSLIDRDKPDWALRSETYPLAYPLPDDECFPFVCFWPQIEPYREVSHASIRHSGSRRGVEGRFREHLSD